METIIIVVLLGILGATLYGTLLPKFMVKYGRKIDARVVACEEVPMKILQGQNGCYEIVVDFYGLQGETIVKSFRSMNKYEPETILPCIYYDKGDKLYPDADTAKKNSRGNITGISVIVATLLFVLYAFHTNGEVVELPEWVGMAFGYLLSIVFVGLGIAGIVKTKGSFREKGTFILFGIVGLAFLCMFLFISFAPKEAESTTGYPVENVEPIVKGSAEDTGSIDATQVFQLFYSYVKEDTKKCAYSITVLEDGSGEMVLFPMVTVSDKGIDQFIPFSITTSSMRALDSFIADHDFADLTWLNSETGENEVQISLYAWVQGEKLGGGGYLDEIIYKEAYELMKELVPESVWQELEDREAEYYRED